MVINCLHCFLFCSVDSDCCGGGGLMSRIRTIKPEFFSSEDIVCLTPLARLFYIALWCEADREGRLDWKLKTFKFRYFPGDDCDIELIANELLDAGLVVLYEADGQMLAEIPTFKTHQVINNREQESTRLPRVKVASQSPLVGKERKGREGKEHASQIRDDEPAPNDTPQKKKLKTKIPIDFAVSDGIKAWAEKNGYSDIEKRLDRFILTCQANGYTYSDWDAAFRKAIVDDWAKLGKPPDKTATDTPFVMDEFLKGHL